MFATTEEGLFKMIWGSINILIAFGILLFLAIVMGIFISMGIRFKCKLGFHNYETLRAKNLNGEWEYEDECSRCGKKRTRYGRTLKWRE